ncbi:IstB transposition helper protein [Halospina denitrificans]|uniref:IstB transposition helper protein n=2 Tax=Halospina denitrificans TaxID=332522 RepID=A0A4R7JYJ9_9GAMM|nr:IstB transposition helper protein [Halospina denitrificans]
MQLEQLFERLKFEYLPDQLDTVCEQAAKKQLDYQDFLAQALETEWAGRNRKGIESRMNQARFPHIKTLEQFDFEFQPSVDRNVLRNLSGLAFVERGENVIFLGPPGVGKTHLSIALGVKAVEAGHRVEFQTLDQLMTRLKKAREENRLDRTLKQLSYPKVLIVDEIGYLPLSRDEASLFFRLINRRYEKASMILTSNKSFADWGEVFGEQVIATAILDRLLHHATTVNIKGESYRLKEKRRAGMLKNNPPAGSDDSPEPNTATNEEDPTPA